MSTIERLRALLAEVPSGAVEYDPDHHWLTRTERLAPGEYGAAIILAEGVPPEEGVLLAEGAGALPALLDVAAAVRRMSGSGATEDQDAEPTDFWFAVDEALAALARLEGAS